MKAQVRENGDIIVRRDDDEAVDETWLNVVEVRPPVTLTQRLVGPEYSYDKGQVFANWTVENIPQQELTTRDLNQLLDAALPNLRQYVTTPAAQINNALIVSTLRLVCRVLIVLIRIQRNVYDGTD